MKDGQASRTQRVSSFWRIEQYGKMIFENLPPPHIYFTSREKAACRNMASHIVGKNFINKENKDSVTLPGPAEWRPEDYDFEAHEFVPDADSVSNQAVGSSLRNLIFKVHFRDLLHPLLA